MSATAPVGTPPTIKTQPNAVKPIMLGLQQPQQQSQQPGGEAAPTSSDPAGGALQQQDIEAGQKAIQENEALKMQLNMHKQVSSLATSGAGSFIGSQIGNLMKGLPALQRKVTQLSLKSASPLTSFVADQVTKAMAPSYQPVAPNVTAPPSGAPSKPALPVPAKAPPPTPLTPHQMQWKGKTDEWKADDAWNRSRNTSLVTKAMEASPFAQAYNKPGAYSFGAGNAAPSWRNTIEGFNEVLRDPADAFDTYVMPGVRDFTSKLRTNWSAGVNPNTLRGMLAKPVDKLTNFGADFTEGAAGNGLPAFWQMLSSAKELGRDQLDLVKDLATAKKPLLDVEFGKDVRTRLPENLHAAPSNALGGLMAVANPLLTAAYPGLMSAVPGLFMGSQTAAPAAQQPAQPPAAPAGQTSPPPDISGVMPWLASLWPMLQRYMGHNPDEQSTLPSVAGSAGHAVRNPSEYA